MYIVTLPMLAVEDGLIVLGNTIITIQHNYFDHSIFNDTRTHTEGTHTGTHTHTRGHTHTGTHTHTHITSHHSQ